MWAPVMVSPNLIRAAMPPASPAECAGSKPALPAGLSTAGVIPIRIADSEIGGCDISFVMPDGAAPSKSDAADPTDRLHLTVIVPEGGLPQNSVLTVNEGATFGGASLRSGTQASPSITGQEPRRDQINNPEPGVRVLNGWEELSFDFVSLA